MLHIPDGVMQALPHPLALLNLPGCRSISDDDLCAWCMHLLYRPGEFSLCRLSLADGIGPSHGDEHGYAQHSPARHAG